MKLTIVVEDVSDNLDGSAFVVQGLEVDYIAQGSTIEEALDNFANGFQATVDEHFKQYGHARHFLKPMRNWPVHWTGIPEVDATIYEIY
jgi:hypothetical protein